MMEDAIRLYFSLGFSYDNILGCLAQLNRMVISMRTLKRTLKKMHLFRRSNYTDVVDIALFLVDEVAKSGQLHGYRMMHLKCLHNGFVVTQEVVRLLLNMINPRGLEERIHRRLQRRAYANPGPNFLWHVDGYDKLKPYGICINGAIDGFSRYVLWLEAHTTNSDPKIVAGYFMHAVSLRRGCPLRVRVDAGTENVHIRDMMKFLRSEGHDQYAQNCVLVGSSNHNQRIERWWGVLRTQNVQFWMDTFSQLKDIGSFTGDFLDRSLVQFCFMDLIQSELDQVARLWNSHRIRCTRNRNLPSGRPFFMYSCPNSYGAQDYLHEVPQHHVDVCQSECDEKGPYVCDETVFELCKMMMEENDLQEPECAEDAIRLYHYLREVMIDGLGRDDA